MILLLNDNKAVVGYGTFTEEFTQYVILTLKDDMSFNPDNYTHIEVEDSALPADIDKYEEYYCYTEEDGFYKNPNWSIDLIPYAKQVPLLKEENAILKEQTSVLIECLLEMSETIYA